MSRSSESSASGGEATPATTVDRSAGEVEHGFPQFLPDGKHFLYFAHFLDEQKNCLMLGTLNGAGPSSENRRIMASKSRGLYAAFSEKEGYLLFLRDSILMARRFRPFSGELPGEDLALPLSGILPQSVLAGFVPMAAAGLRRIAAQPGSPLEQLMLVSRDGTKIKTLGIASEYATPRFSPDGRKVMYSHAEPGKATIQIWTMDLQNLNPARLTFGVRDFYGAWSPHGEEIIYSSAATGTLTMHRRRMEGVADAIPLGPSSDPQYVTDWSKQGDFVLYTKPQGNNSNQLWVWPLVKESRPFQFVQSQSGVQHGQFAPDTKWIAYTSEESGIEQIYVQAFRGVPATGTKYQVSVTGGREPRWRGDGRELFYVTPDLAMMAVPVLPGNGKLDFGTPVRLFQARMQRTAFTRHSYDVAADGQSFVLVTELENSSSNKINVLLNWEGALRP